MNRNETSETEQFSFYKEIAKSEANKFDNRLFWFTGGVAALSLGYFQTTDTLHTDLILIIGYTSLLLSIVLLLGGLIASSNISNELAGWYKEKSIQKSIYTDQQIKESIEKYDEQERRLTYVNIGALFLTIVGVTLIVVYMFMTSCSAIG